MKKTLLCLLPLSLTLLRAQPEEIERMPPLRVQEQPPVTAAQITGLDNSVAAHLQYVPGVRVLSQGHPGGSSDLSIRGSAFSGAGLTLGGIALRNPQTEHFHSDLLFPAWWLGEPTVLTGVSQVAFGEGHLVGTVSLHPLPMRERCRFSLGVDQEGGFLLEGGFQHTQETLHNNTFGMGAFGGHTDSPNVDNLGNDLESTRAGAQMQYHSPFGQADIWLGWQEKDFGATGYYGVDPSFEAEETTEDLMFIGMWRSFDPVSPFDFSVSIREFQDDYRLHLPDGLFRNEHTSDTRALQGGFRHPFNDQLGASIRAAFEEEEIKSSNLGNHDRHRGSLTLLPDWLVTDQVRLYAGGRAEIFEDFDDQAHPLLRIEFTADPTLLFHAEYSESARQPSFTELNYESPASLGNQGLELQTIDNIELGLSWTPNPETFASAALFRRDSADTVDWIRRDADSTRWEAENIGDVETRGLELLLRRTVHPDLHITNIYTYLNKDADDEPFASRYVLDYAEHHLELQADWHATPTLRLEAAQSWLLQADNELRDNGGDSQWLTSLALHFRPEDMDHVQFTLAGTNLFDDDFRVFAGQDTYTERRFSASVTVDW